MKTEFERPCCPKCGKPMRLVATGMVVRNFRCDECGEYKVVEKEE